MLRDEWEPPPAFGPHEIPIDRFAHLPVRTRAWLESLGAKDLEELQHIRDFCAGVPKHVKEWLATLSPDDLKEIHEAIRFQRSAKTVGRFGRVLVVTAVTIFISTVTMGEKIITTLKWMAGGAK